ncbi:MAG: hypothetical protein QM820_09020 [Minicystis sp.]
MERWRFDLDKIRRNWERDADLPSNALPQKFARVEAPRDPYPEAEALLGRVRTLVRAEVPAYEAALTPFLDEVQGLVRRLATKPGEGETVDRKALHAELDRVLGDVEDMLALYSGIGR